MCPNLSQQHAEENRANVNRVIRGSPKSNLSKAEVQAIRELKGDKSWIVLTADKGVAMVVFDRQDYINKSSNVNWIIFSKTEQLNCWKTNFCQISIMASSGLRKMFI